MSKRPKKAATVAAPAVLRNAPWADCVTIGPATLYLGDCTEVMAALDEASVHAVVTDPPYELGFMGKHWDRADGVASDPATWAHARRLLTPGGHLVAFAGSRTYHRIAMAIERAEFEIRDQLMWLYGSGFPKSLNVAKAIETGGQPRAMRKARMGDAYVPSGRGRKNYDHGAGSVMGAIGTDAGAVSVLETPSSGADAKWASEAPSKEWEGWGTALKPAHEPIALARKPFRGSVAANTIAHGTGAMNIDAARIEYQNGTDHAAAAAAAAAARVMRDEPGRERWAGHGGGAFNDPAGSLAGWAEKSELGRWPANVITDGSAEVLEAFPSSAREAIRFFYAAKASKAEREYGLDDHPKRRGGMLSNTSGQNITRRDGGEPGPRANVHPTVKPIALMAWLCRLITPPGGVALDPFMGSGSTGIAAVRHGFRFVGIEQSPEYFEIAKRRIARAVDDEAAMPDIEREITRAVRAIQLDLLAGETGREGGK